MISLFPSAATVPSGTAPSDIDRLSLFATLLLAGSLSPERQVALGGDLARLGGQIALEHRRMQRALDELALDAQADAVAAEAAALLARAPAAIPCHNVLPFPRRPLPPLRPLPSATPLSADEPAQPGLDN